jgi:hypothetical protein
VLAVFFVAGAAIGCWAVLRPQTSDGADVLALPGVFLSLCFSIGPHGSTKLFLWSVPICNGVAYSGLLAFAFWLRVQTFTLGSGGALQRSVAWEQRSKVQVNAVTRDVELPAR